MLNWLKIFFLPRIRVQAGTVLPAEAEPGIIYLTAGNFACSYCGGEDFYAGARGGISTNMLCANDKCRRKFNFTPMMNNRVEDLHSTW